MIWRLRNDQRHRHHERDDRDERRRSKGAHASAVCRKQADSFRLRSRPSGGDGCRTSSDPDLPRKRQRSRAPLDGCDDAELRQYMPTVPKQEQAQ
jgi:hypothetical protein